MKVGQMRVALPAAYLVCLAWTAHAHTPLEYRVLAEVICERETRGHPDPDHAIGAHGELGRCQIKSGTAILFGITFDALAIAEVSIQTAVMVLRWCSANGWHGAYRGAHCYNAGPGGAIGIARVYAKTVAAAYAEALREAMWRNMAIRIVRR